MKRLGFLLALSGFLVPAMQADAKETMKLAFLAEVSSHSLLYAIEAGKIKSDKVDIKVELLGVNAIDAAASSGQYDAVQVSSLTVPRAALQGLSLKVIGITFRYPQESDVLSIWVPKDSPIKTIDDLKGKTIGVSSLNSSTTNNIRLGLAKRHKVNASLDAGDFKWVQVPSTALVPALQSGRVDAGNMFLTQAYDAGRSGDYRQVTNGIKNLHEAFGAGTTLPSGVLVAQSDKLDARAPLYQEFLRMLKASADYVKANEAEVFAAMGAKYKQDAEAVKMGFYGGDRDFRLTETDYKGLGLIWAGYKEIGILKETGQLDQLVWKPAIGK
jgi:NitT/TauT family transport system substrate-binding protein